MNRETNHKLVTIIGPTGSGKSEIAIRLANDFSGEIISADSRQIYKKMDIGTGKEPGFLEISNQRGIYTKKAYISQGIPHYMIDIVHPNTIYSVSKFQKKAKNIKKDICSRNKNPIIAGGTMFWAQALVEDTTFAEVPPNFALRKKLEQKEANELFEMIKSKDKARAEDISKKNEINNKVRLIRALEIIESKGFVPKIKKSLFNPQTNLVIAISIEKETLYRKQELRLDQWLRNGIFEEILFLHDKMHVPWTRLEGFGLEYKWCTKYVRNQISFGCMRQNTLRDLRKYTKRQYTWIKRWDKQIGKIEYVKNYTEVKKLTNKFYLI